MPSKKTAKPKIALPIAPDLAAPELYINRELSWLEFNQRVLEEAQDASNPLLERLKFLTIVSSNLDEFFEVRVAGLQQQAETGGAAGADGLTGEQTLEAIGKRAHRLVDDQYRCYLDVAIGLTANGIELATIGDLDAHGSAWAAEYFHREVFPVLTPLAIDPSHPFPQLLNKSLNLAVVLRAPDSAPGKGAAHAGPNSRELRFGVVQVPRVLPRLVALPASLRPAGRHVYVFLSSIISQYIGLLFPGLSVHGCYSFRVTRNSELYLDEDEADNLLEAMQQQLQRRKRGDAVRVEVQRGCDPRVTDLLLATFELDPIDLYEVDGPVNLTRLITIYGQEKRPELKEPPFTPAPAPELAQVETPDELFAAIAAHDILLHHPYDSFKAVDDFITMAADDPRVLAIKQTLYRTSGDSPIVRGLMRAAQNGKQVTALVELKARFDEENNIQWARQLEESGVHVLYGLVGLKTHCKLAMVVRREQDSIVRYVHLGTGNYNEVTAHLYTDLGLLTARPAIGEDAAKIFNLLTGMSEYPGLDKLQLAPFGLQHDVIAKIDREAAHARAKHHRSKPRIAIKMNALVDPTAIQALYKASQAGVRVDLLVRGICCLRPGLRGISENIRVYSIVDRFLEHSRIFYFANNGHDEIYAGSADWMPRNFLRRVEVVFPIEDAALKARVKSELLDIMLDDNTKARRMRPDGTYSRPRRRANEPALRAQSVLLALAARAAAPPGSVAADGPARDGPARDGAGRDAAHGIKIVPRGAPRPIAPHATDGRAGTSADPILQSLAEQLKSEEAAT